MEERGQTQQPRERRGSHGWSAGIRRARRLGRVAASRSHSPLASVAFYNGLAASAPPAPAVGGGGRGEEEPVAAAGFLPGCQGTSYTPALGSAAGAARQEPGGLAGLPSLENLGLV